MNFVKRNKGKIIFLTILIMTLAISFFASENRHRDIDLEDGFEQTENITPEEEPVAEEEKAEEAEKPKEKEKEPEKIELYCTLSVKCDTILSDISRLDESKRALVGNGTIFPEKQVKFSDGESVFDVLLREMKENKIHLEFVNTPVYNSVYIEGIGNIYEFDAGELSGWMYKVNGEFPNFGCSKYILKNGDKVEFVYTCDLGKDVGGSYYENNGE